MKTNMLLTTILIKRNILVMCVITLCACDNTGIQESQNSRPTPADYLGSEIVDGYLRAEEPRNFSFPEDHGTHPGFLNEWWYLTGNLETEYGRRFGYQVTFFKNALRPESENDCSDGNAGCTNHLWMGHAAVSDISNATHYAAEIFTRQEPGLAGAGTTPFRIWIQDWQMLALGNDFPWELEVFSDDFALTLQLSALKSPVLQGDRGLSQKSPELGNASYYYSMTRLPTQGQIHLAGESHNVEGQSWLDREWSTSALASDQSGWDWFSLQLNDNTELMYYQLRDDLGNTHSSSSGNFTSLMGLQTRVDPEDIQLEEQAYWQATDGTSYTTQWRMQYAGKDWIIRAAFDDQLMNVTFQYWEGAVDVLSAVSGEKVGQGYLEMVR
ncbi:MAG: lipocalin-like domain-containing protein [Pseudomonadales bacterium]